MHVLIQLLHEVMFIQLIFYSGSAEEKTDMQLTISQS